MKKTMKLGLILTVAVALCFSVVSILQAGPPKRPTDALPPGGQTIGGPGQFTFTSNGQSIYFTSGSNPPNVCVTVVNRGDLIDIKLTSTVVNTACSPEPGETVTCCAESVTSVAVACIDSGDCKGAGFYRLDLRN